MVGIGCRGDYEINGASAWLRPAGSDRGCQASPLAGDCGIEGQRMEGCLDDAETLCATGALVIVLGDEDTEVQLRQRCGADRAFEVVWSILRDQHGRVEDRSHQLGERVDQAAGQSLEIPRERLGCRGCPDRSKPWAADPLLSGGRAQVRGRSSGNRDRELLAGLCPAQDLADVVAELLLRDRRHARSVAVLLPRHSGPALRPRAVNGLYRQHPVNDLSPRGAVAQWRELGVAQTKVPSWLSRSRQLEAGARVRQPLVLQAQANRLRSDRGLAECGY